MKTVKEIFTYERLLQSFNECRKGQLWKSSVINFQMDYIGNLLTLEKEIQEGTYKSLPPNIVFINERGKIRKIQSQHIRDRVVHKIINQDILIPTFHKSFILQNTASQKNKGVDYAIRTLKNHLGKSYRKWGKDFYILFMDMSNYFGSIPHNYLLKLLQEKIKNEELMKICAIDLKKDGIGISLGSEMNQTYALLFLNEFDHLIKEKFHIKEYGRYMDDMYLLLDDKEKLKEIREFAEIYFCNIGVRMNSKKTQIIPMKNGFYFLGFRWILKEGGHIVLIPKQQLITRNKNKLRKFKKLLDRNKIEYKRIEESYRCMRGHLMRSGNFHSVNRIDKFYNKLFINDWRFNHERLHRQQTSRN